MPACLKASRANRSVHEPCGEEADLPLPLRPAALEENIELRARALRISFEPSGGGSRATIAHSGEAPRAFTQAHRLAT